MLLRFTSPLVVAAVLFFFFGSTNADSENVNECQCWVARQLRTACDAGAFLPEDECKTAGCCSSSKRSTDGTPTCFKPTAKCHQLSQCHIQLEKRRPCDRVHFTAGSKLCQQRGCCFDSTYTPSCYRAFSLYDGPGSYKPRTTPLTPQRISRAQSRDLHLSLSKLQNFGAERLHDVMRNQMIDHKESVAFRTSMASLAGGRKVLVQCPYDSRSKSCGGKDILMRDCVNRLCCWNPTLAAKQSTTNCVYPRIARIPEGMMPTVEPIRREEKGEEGEEIEKEVTIEPYELPEDELIPNGNRGVFTRSCRVGDRSQLCQASATNSDECTANSCCWDQSTEICFAPTISYQPFATFTDDVEGKGAMRDWVPFDPIEAQQPREEPTEPTQEHEIVTSSTPTSELVYNDFSLIMLCPETVNGDLCEKGVTRRLCMSMFCCWVDDPKKHGKGTCVRPQVDLIGNTKITKENKLVDLYPSIPFEGPNFWRPSLPERNFVKEDSIMTVFCPAASLINGGNIGQTTCGSDEIFTRDECVNSGCCWRPWKVFDSDSESPCQAPKIEQRNLTEVISKHDSIISTLVQPMESRWGEWDDWSVCKAVSPCSDEGRQFRSRRCVSPVGVMLDHAVDIASGCVGAALEVRTCTDLFDCESGLWSEWSPWTTCSETCKSGKSLRTRTCYLPEDCPITPSFEENSIETENKVCNTEMCEVWGPWIGHDDCDAECKSFGNSTRFRLCEKFAYTKGRIASTQVIILKSLPMYDLKALASSQPEAFAVHAEECLLQTTQCFNNRDCVYIWGEWGNWTQCDSKCTPGKQSRERPCLKLSPQIGPVEVPATFCARDLGESQMQEITCEGERCKEWDNWFIAEKCNADCDGVGMLRKARLCKRGDFNPTIHPRECYRIDEKCTGRRCPRVQWGLWGPWSDCSTSCTPGITTRARRCMDTQGIEAEPDLCGGNALEVVQCNENFCEVWGEWQQEECQGRCGGRGLKTTRRICSDGGAANDVLANFLTIKIPESCHTKTEKCIRACTAQWGEWSKWSKCSRNCSPGTSSRTRECQLEDGTKQNSMDCPGGEIQSFEKRDCNVGMCEDWNKWDKGKCTGTCRKAGTQPAQRTCVGRDDTWLVTTYAQNPNCYNRNTRCRPRCARWGGWGTFGPCNDKCSPGKRSRRRLCLRNGKPVDESECTTNPGKIVEYANCNMKLCSSYGPWKENYKCDGICGEDNATRERKRDCYSGIAPEQCLVDRIPCRPRCGPGWGPWTEWSDCSDKCAPGIRNRTRICYNGDETIDPAECMKVKKNGLGGAIETEDCNVGSCPSWAPWQQHLCVAECNVTAVARRIRICLEPVTGYVPNECRNDYVQCLGKCIATWDDWTPWSPCSLSCGPGKQTSVRRCSMNGISVDPNYCEEGNKTPKTLRIKKCHATMCDSWSRWRTGPCAVQCGGAGISVRERKCLGKGTLSTPEQPTETACYRKEVLCGTDPCPNKYAPWGDWSECSSLCSPGTMRRTRKCLTQGLKFGDCQALGPALETRKCNKYSCRIWKPWEYEKKCVVSAGQNVRNRRRECSYSIAGPLGRTHPKHCFEGQVSCAFASA
uniref:SCO-spondin-like n=1 Tax=Styela clava TaxID=7725 RepID=UPI001939711E|nr:SCO-spondin-like [Styela clava]